MKSNYFNTYDEATNAMVRTLLYDLHLPDTKENRDEAYEQLSRDGWENILKCDTCGCYYLDCFDHTCETVTA